MRATARRRRSTAAHVYRVDPASGEVERVIDGMVRPNGLAFSPDEKILYVADTGATHKENGPAPYPALRRSRPTARA